LKQVISVLHLRQLFVDYLNRKQRILFWKKRVRQGILHWFLGELNKEGFNKDTLKSDLYVNLRCMKIMKDQAHLYMGCGITKDSNPRKEWRSQQIDDDEKGVVGRT
jgi:isochorismate synthase